MSTEEEYFCARCGSITPHEVVTSGGIAALLCHGCVQRWAGQSGAKKKQRDEEVKFTGRRVSWNHRLLK